MDALGKDLEEAIHDAVPVLGVELLGELHRPLHIGEEHGDLLALPLEGGLRVEDLRREVLRGVGADVTGARSISGRAYPRAADGVPAAIGHHQRVRREGLCGGRCDGPWCAPLPAARTDPGRAPSAARWCGSLGCTRVARVIQDRVVATPWAASPLSSPSVPCNAAVGFSAWRMAAEQVRRRPRRRADATGEGARWFTVCSDC